MENLLTRYWRKNELAIRHKAGGSFATLICYLIFIAISFMILFPLLEKAAVVFQSRDDLLDNTVKYIAKEPTLYTLKTWRWRCYRCSVPPSSPTAWRGLSSWGAASFSRLSF